MPAREGALAQAAEAPHRDDGHGDDGQSQYPPQRISVRVYFHGLDSTF